MNDGATPRINPFPFLRDRRLFRGFVGTFAVNGVGAVLLAVTAVAFARLLGPDGFGSYSFAIACVDLVAVVAVLGLDKLLIRELAAFHRGVNWPAACGLIRTADTVSLVLAVALAVTFVVTIWAFRSGLDVATTKCAYVAAIALPFRALLWLRRGALVGLGDPVRGQAVMVTVYPALTLAAVFAIAAMGLLGPGEAVAGNVAAAAGAAILAHVWLRRRVGAAPPRRDWITPVGWAGPALAIAAVTGLAMLNIRMDIVLLGFLRDAEDAGAYAAASRVAELLRFAALALIPSLAPRLAGQWAARDTEGLRRSTARAARFLLAVSAPVGLALVVSSPWIMELFGGSFRRAWLVLCILAVGHLVGLALGLVDVLALMVGQQNAAALTLGVGAAANLALNILLIPPLGIYGAALATVISSILANALLAVVLWRRIGVNPSVFGGAAADPGRSKPS